MNAHLSGASMGLLAAIEAVNACGGVSDGTPYDEGYGRAIDDALNAIRDLLKACGMQEAA